MGGLRVDWAMQWGWGPVLWGRVGVLAWEEKRVVFIVTATRRCTKGDRKAQYY